MIEYVCKDVVFHFNKKHLEDQTIPMWVIKLRGETFYVDHVECNVSWSTKETPENTHTKGSIKVKHCLVTIDDNNVANIRSITDEDKDRLNSARSIIRVITLYKDKLQEHLDTFDIESEDIRGFGGSCTRTWYVTDLYSRNDFTQLKLIMGDDIRILKPNEDYYKLYSKYSVKYVDVEEIESEDDEFEINPDDLYRN